MRAVGQRFEDLRFRVHGFGEWTLALRGRPFLSRVQGLRRFLEGLGLRGGVRVQGSGFGVWGLI